MRKLATSVMTILIAIGLSVLICSMFKTVTVIIDEKPAQYKTFKSTVEKVLEEENIVLGPNDKVEPSLNSKVTKNSIIKIKRAVNIKVSVDNKEYEVLTPHDDVAALIKSEGITLKEQDKIRPSLDTKLAKDMKIEITRVNTKILTGSKPLSFKTVVKKDNNLANTVKKTIQEGTQGEKQIKTSVTYENGKEVSRKVISENIVKKPKDRIIIAGTMPVLSLSRGGNPIPYRKVLTVRATAYSPNGGAISDYTSSGRRAVRKSGGYSTIAVDPRVIPIGTKVYVQGYGLATAADTGSAIKGRAIDVYFNTRSEALKWAVKYIKVYILK